MNEWMALRRETGDNVKVAQSGSTEKRCLQNDLSAYGDLTVWVSSGRLSREWVP